jgi:hypothetical protein
MVWFLFSVPSFFNSSIPMGVPFRGRDRVILGMRIRIIALLISTHEVLGFSFLHLHHSLDNILLSDQRGQGG